VKREKAVIIGAGPAGLTAAYELLARTQIHPIVLEMTPHLGGLSRTAQYRGNRMDIGGHRFFSKSDRVMQWWLSQMPLEAGGGAVEILGRLTLESIAGEAPDPETADNVMLLRQRRSRIYYQRKFFDYPLSLSLDTVRKLGLRQMSRIGLSYLRSAAVPIRPEANLEQFFINRFGRELYRTFFESYTEKVWGVPCARINAQWGAQRIKGLSVKTALLNALARPLRRGGVSQKGTETSLIEQFLYPKHGPGQMWERVARVVQSRGGDVLVNMKVRRLELDGRRVTAVHAVDVETGDEHCIPADYCFSTMPVKHLVRSLGAAPPDGVRRIGEGLVYRDFITVGLLADELKVRERTRDGGGGLSQFSSDENGTVPLRIRDNWIYIQEPDVTVGRVQIFNNWSPYLVADRSKTWLGLEYFCNQGDRLWVKSNKEMLAFAAAEMARLGLLEAGAVRDGTVLRVPKAYPAYFGAYGRFAELRAWFDRLENLFLIGRNGMHRYNNQDHSMLAAMAAVDNILAGRTDKSNLWSVNAEPQYHETKSRTPALPCPAAAHPQAAKCQTYQATSTEDCPDSRGAISDPTHSQEETPHAAVK
jgi:protoporphyrinogen oxidase